MIQQQPVMLAAAPINNAAGNTIAPSNDRRSHSESRWKTTSELYSNLRFCLLFIGIANIVFSCLDLLTGIISLSMGHYFASDFFYWLGFVLAIVNGPLVLAARVLLSQLNRHSILACCLGTASAIFHLIDFINLLTSVILLGSGGVNSMHSTYTKTFVGNNTGWTYNFYYHIQSPLIAEAPRLVIVTSLVALDSWQLLLIKYLRRFFDQADDSNPTALESEVTGRVVQTVNGNLTAESRCKLASASTALCLAGAINIMYGCLDLIVGVLELVALDDAWLLALYSVLVVFVFAILNGSWTIYAARRSPREILRWANSTCLLGIFTSMVNFIGLVIAIVTVAMMDTFTSEPYQEDHVSKYKAFNYTYYYYYEDINPATLDTARLVTLLSLLTASGIQLFAVFRIRVCFRNHRRQPSIAYTASALPSVSTVNGGGLVPGQCLNAPVTSALPQNFYIGHQTQSPSFASPQNAYAIAVQQPVVVGNAEVDFSQPPAYTTLFTPG